MNCIISDRRDLGTINFKFTVAGVVKDGRVGCGGVLYAALAVLFTIKSALELFGTTSFIHSRLLRGWMEPWSLVDNFSRYCLRKVVGGCFLCRDDEVLKVEWKGEEAVALL
ncbi:hypothetical protein GQ457_13G011980 [Hibiscus cannabinus]